MGRLADYAFEARYGGHKTAIFQAGAAGLASMKGRYGNGSPSEPGSEISFYFHNGKHGEQVGRDAARMATMWGLFPAYVALARAAGKTHDEILTDGHGINLPRGDMEQRTAEMFEKRLRDKNVPERLAKIGSLLVLGTTPHIDENGFISHQEAQVLSYPSKEAEKAALSVASADLAGAYSPDAGHHSFNYYKELNGYTVGNSVPFEPEKLMNYETCQIDFVQAYQFPHPEGNRIFGGMRDDVVQFHENVLRDLEWGRIEDWTALDGLAEQFRRDHWRDAAASLY